MFFPDNRLFFRNILQFFPDNLKVFRPKVDFKLGIRQIKLNNV